MNAIQTSQNIHDEIRDQYYSVIQADDMPLSASMKRAWQSLQRSYGSLPADDYLPDGRRYRYRRYDSFYFQPVTGELTLLPHTPYFQSKDINPVTGGTERHFAPLTSDIVNNPFLQELIRFDFAQFPLEDIDKQYQPWQVDVHLIRVVADPNNEAHPTPEGIHRDGAEYVTVHLAELDNAQGGAVTIYDDDRQPLETFTLDHLLDAYLLKDTKLWHKVEPITPADDSKPAIRSILTFDYHYQPELSRRG